MAAEPSHPTAPQGRRVIQGHISPHPSHSTFLGAGRRWRAEVATHQPQPPHTQDRLSAKLCPRAPGSTFSLLRVLVQTGSCITLSCLFSPGLRERLRRGFVKECSTGAAQLERVSLTWHQSKWEQEPQTVLVSSAASCARAGQP